MQTYNKYHFFVQKITEDIGVGNDRQFEDNIFQCICLNKIIVFLFKLSQCLVV